MRILFKASMVMAVLFIIAGCYESKVPMAPVKDAVFDAKLIGRWKAVSYTHLTLPTILLV